MATRYTANWSTRLGLFIKKSGGTEQRVQPYNSINVNFTRAVSLIDSVDDANIGFIFGNRRYSFSIEVFPVKVGDAKDSDLSPMKFLNELFLTGDIFEIRLFPYTTDVSNVIDGTDNTWAYTEVKLQDCIFTTGGLGLYDTTAGLKIIRFDGLALATTVIQGGDLFH